MIKKSTFEDIVDFMLKQSKKEDEFCDFLTDLVGSEYGHCTAYIYTRYEDKMLRLLNEVMEDDDNWIGYYIYDFNSFSPKDKEEQLKETPFLESPGKLYDYLMEKRDEATKGND